MIRQLNNDIAPGLCLNEAEVVRALRRDGFFDSGIPRRGIDARREPVPPKGKSQPIFRHLPRKVLQYFSPEDFEKYIHAAMRDEGNNLDDEKGYCPTTLDRGAPTEDDRDVLLSFSSEEPILRGDHYEILSHDEGAVDFAQLQRGAPVLVDHAGERVGTVEEAWLQDKRGMARIRFDWSQGGEKTLQAVNNGVLRGVSMGCRYDSGARIFGGEINGTPICWIARWTPHEISFSSLPLDRTVGVGRIPKEGNAQSVIQKEKTMGVQEKKFRVRPASDFELVEKLGAGLSLSEGEFDLLAVLKKHDPETFKMVREVIWWEKYLEGLSDEEFDKLVPWVKTRRGVKK
jgi:hypothetical protein